MAAMFCFSEDDLTCPVCCDIFREPVVLACSHSFCKGCVQTYWAGQDSCVCPTCRAGASEGEPLVSLTLKNLCESAMKERDQREVTGPELIGLCSQHYQPITLVCLEDSSPVCQVCPSVGKHRGHECTPIQEVEAELKESVKEAIENLHKKLRKFEKAKQSCDETTQHIQSQAKSMILHIKKEFRTFHCFLNEEEEVRISAVRREEKLKCGIMEQKAADISREVESLFDKIRETEAEMEGSTLAFLQNFGATMKRAECTPPDPEPVPGALIDVAAHLGNLKFRVWEKMQTLVKFTPVTLDPNTANSWLEPSEDLTHMWVRAVPRKLPDNPERDESYQSTLGSSGFSTGTHSWDILVGDSTRWALGVAYHTASRKGRPDLSPEGGFWTIARYNRTYTAQTNPSTPLAVKGQPQRIRVHLNWDEGRVTFTDLTDGTHMYTFEQAFTEKVFPYFAHGCTSTPLYLQPAKVSVVLESQEQCERAM